MNKLIACRGVILIFRKEIVFASKYCNELYMHSKKQVTNSYSNTNAPTSTLYLFPIIFALAFIPLIVLIAKVPTYLHQYSWYSNSAEIFDGFLYYKQIFLYITAAVMVLLFCFYLYKYRDSFRFHFAFYFLVIFMIMVVLSTVFSEHKINTIFGVPGQFQTLFILLIYCILCFYSYQLIHTEKDIHKILKPLLYSIGFLIILGISQMLGHDLLTSSIGKSIMGIFSNESTDMSLNFGKMVFLTFYNPNYVGLYCILILPILFVLFLYSQHLKQRLVYLILFIGLTVCLIGSGSATGIITIIPCLLLLFFLCRHKFGKYKKIVTVVYSAFIVLGICLFFIMNIPQRLHSTVFKETNYEIQQIELMDDHVTFICNNGPLNISYNPNAIDGEVLKITDGNGIHVESVLSEDGSYLLINDSRYPKLLLQLILYEDLDGNELNVFNIIYNNTNWYFTNDTDDGTYYYINNYGNLIKINNTSPSALPESFNSFASGRGYIWSKTLPLLKDHLVVGSGADTFLFDFPNDDYVGMYNNGNHGKIMTKPHSFYLQTWVETGLISLIALLIFYGIYVIMSFRLYLMKPLDNNMKQIGAAIFVGSLGYMFALLFNDSSITVAPVFWILLGIGFAINQITKRDSSQ